MARVMGHASINYIVEEMATTMGELVATLTDSHAKQVESLMKSATAALEKLTVAILLNNSNKVPIDGDAKKAKTAVWAEKKRNATNCPHCSRIHPNHTHAQCWELLIMQPSVRRAGSLSRAPEGAWGFQ